MNARLYLNTPIALGLIAVLGPLRASPDSTSPVATLPEVRVSGQAIANGSAADGYRVSDIELGPLGNRSAQDTPFSIYATSADLIRNVQATNTSEALKYVPTVYTNTGASQVTPYFTMRGFSASNWTYNMAVDGMRSFDIWEPLDDKTGIQVMTGATAFLYGITSPAGVVNYLLKRPTAALLAEVTVGTYDQQVYGQIDLGGPIDTTPGLAYRVNIAYANPGQTGVEHQTQERYVFSGALDWEIVPGTLLALDAGTARRSLDFAQALFMTTSAIGIPNAPDTSRNWGAPYTGATDSTSRIGAALSSRLNDIFTLRLRFRNSDIDREYALARQVWQNRKLDYKWRMDAQEPWATVVNQYQLFVDADFQTGPLVHKLTLGGTQDDFSSSNNGFHGTTFNTIYPGNLFGTPSYPPAAALPRGTSTAQETTYGTLTAIDQVSFGERFSGLLGITQARVDDSLEAMTAKGVVSTSDYDDSATTPAFALSFKPVSALTTYVSYVEALQQGLVAGPTTANAGQTFSPFVSEQTEAGAKATIGGMALNLAYFYINQANQYVDPATNIASQNGQAIHQGWEFSLTGRVLRQLTLTGGFTVLDAQIKKATAYEGNVPQGVPEQLARLYAEYDLAVVPGLTLTAGISYTGKVPWDPANTLYVDPVTLFDAGLRYRVKLHGKETTWRLTVANLSGEDYWTTRSGILYLGEPMIVAVSATVAF